MARIAAATAAVMGGALVIAAGGAWWVLRSSLPQLDGQVSLGGIHARIRLERDAAGVPTITAQNRNDLAFALGYLHAQDRFFQMDLLRRAAAGELSALLGPALLPTDRDLRRHRFRDVARSALTRLDAPMRTRLDAYVSTPGRAVGGAGRRAPVRPWNQLLPHCFSHAAMTLSPFQKVSGGLGRPSPDSYGGVRRV